MGVINVTPDSFSDGGRFGDDPQKAIAHGRTLLEQGAHILDIGGETTRPGSQPVTAAEEMRRVLGVIQGLRKETDAPISIDTTKAVVAEAALAAGASWINDVSAGRFDPAMASVAAAHHCPVILMHSRKTPADMQQQPHYDDVVVEVRQELQERINYFVNAGVHPEDIIIDPGIGFAKRLEDNLTLQRHMASVVQMGFPVLIGTSRKSSLGAITGKPVEQRLAASLASVAWAYLQGVKIFRVHDVDQTSDCLKVLTAIQTAK
jgi:dihydropteroate synthase